MKKRKSVCWLIVFMSIAVFLAFTTVQAVVPPDVTDAQIAAAIQGGQKYLINNFHDNGDGTGYFGPTGYPVATTGTAVAALLETGAYSDPAYKAIIDKAIAYLKTFVQSDGGIYADNPTYECGIGITALALYGPRTFVERLSAHGGRMGFQVAGCKFQVCSCRCCCWRCCRMCGRSRPWASINCSSASSAVGANPACWRSNMRCSRAS